MADHHGEVEYATATGNDYPEHEATYEAFLHLTYIGIVNVISVVIGSGPRRCAWDTGLSGGLLIAVASVAALQGLVFNSRVFSNVVLVLAFLGVRVLRPGLIGRSAAPGRRLQPVSRSSRAAPAWFEVSSLLAEQPLAVNFVRGKIENAHRDRARNGPGRAQSGGNA